MGGTRGESYVVGELASLNEWLSDFLSMVALLLPCRWRLSPALYYIRVKDWNRCAELDRNLISFMAKRLAFYSYNGCCLGTFNDPWKPTLSYPNLDILVQWRNSVHIFVDLRLRQCNDSDENNWCIIRWRNTWPVALDSETSSIRRRQKKAE